MKGPEVSLRDDGIMRIEYPLHANVDIVTIKNEYRKRIKITKKKVPILVILHGLAALHEKAKQFLCGPEHSKITSAAAILLDPDAGYFEHSEVLLNIFKDVDKPPYDLKIFTNEEEAITWLEQYLKK